MKRTYSELLKYHTYDDRLKYLMLYGVIGYETFGYDRYLNQRFYQSKEWRDVHGYVVTRDLGCDLGIEGLLVPYKIVVHHMNPITLEQMEQSDPMILDPEYLITTSDQTHRAIHYGYTAETDPRSRQWSPRKPYDTCPWKKL